LILLSVTPPRVTAMETKESIRAEFVLGPFAGEEATIPLGEDHLPPAVLWRPKAGSTVPYVRLHLALGRGWIYKWEPSTPRP
jgi:hypothetical protein